MGGGTHDDARSLPSGGVIVRTAIQFVAFPRHAISVRSTSLQYPLKRSQNMNAS